MNNKTESSPQQLKEFTEESKSAINNQYSEKSHEEESEVEVTPQKQHVKGRNLLPGVRQRMLNETLKYQMKTMQRQKQKLEQNLSRRSSKQIPSNQNFISETQEASSDDGDKIVEALDHPYIKFSGNNVYIQSPTFGDCVKIKNPHVKFGSSKNAMKDLMHVEEQIKEMGVLPDFGYGFDNYILSQHEKNNKWKTLSSLIGEKNKFEWLMSYIKFQKLKSEVKVGEEQEEQRKNARAYQRAQGSKQKNDAAQQAAKTKKQPLGQAELDELQKLLVQSKQALGKFKNQNRIGRATPRTVTSQNRNHNQAFNQTQYSVDTCRITVGSSDEESSIPRSQLFAENESQRNSLIRFLEDQNYFLRQKITTTCLEIKRLINLDFHLVNLPKLRQAKISVVSLLRAAKKNNYMLLSLDQCPEIQIIGEVIPEIYTYRDYIIKMRMHQSLRLQNPSVASNKLPQISQDFKQVQLSELQEKSIESRYGKSQAQERRREAQICYSPMSVNQQSIDTKRVAATRYGKDPSFPRLDTNQGINELKDEEDKVTIEVQNDPTRKPFAFNQASNTKFRNETKEKQQSFFSTRQENQFSSPMGRVQQSFVFSKEDFKRGIPLSKFLNMSPMPGLTSPNQTK